MDKLINSFTPLCVASSSVKFNFPDRKIGSVFRVSKEWVYSLWSLKNLKFSLLFSIKNMKHRKIFFIAECSEVDWDERYQNNEKLKFFGKILDRMAEFVQKPRHLCYEGRRKYHVRLLNTLLSHVRHPWDYLLPLLNYLNLAKTVFSSPIFQKITEKMLKNNWKNYFHWKIFKWATYAKLNLTSLFYPRGIRYGKLSCSPPLPKLTFGARLPT